VDFGLIVQAGSQSMHVSDFSADSFLPLVEPHRGIDWRFQNVAGQYQATL